MFPRLCKSSPKLISADGAAWSPASCICSLGLELLLWAHIAAASPLSWTHYSEPQSSRPHFHERSAHSRTLDTNATATASAPVPKDPGFVVVPHAPDCRTLAGSVTAGRSSIPDQVPRGIPLARTSSYSRKEEYKKTLAAFAPEDPNSPSHHCYLRTSIV